MAEETANPSVSLTKSEVVKRFDVSRVTLDRHIKSGKISALKGNRIGKSEPPKFEWKIDLSEVQRVLKERDAKGGKPRTSKAGVKVETEIELRLAQQQIEHLQQQLRDKAEHVRDAQKSSEDWKHQFESSQARLEDLRDRGFFKRLFG
jgi:hypothetical protein